MILYGLLDRRIEMETNEKSILIGNGLDIQVGGNDYLKVTSKNHRLKP